MLRLRDGGRRPDGRRAMVQDYLAASIGKAEFFGQDMYMVHVTGWPPDALHARGAGGVVGRRAARAVADGSPGRPARSAAGPGRRAAQHATFSLMNSGNRTLRAPKRSWKVNFEVGDSKDRLVDMSRLNLKAMYNDPSQMREALAWQLFATAGVPASRHTYAKLAINDRYMGLFFFVEQVDERFLRDHFGSNDRGNLYKAYCGDVGCATLERRVGADGDDGGRQYFTASPDDRNVSPEDQRGRPTRQHLRRPRAACQDDRRRRACPAGTIGSARDAFRASVQGIMNVRAFLRWAGVNLLLGSWDNYFATPANYYLYNAGHKGAKNEFMDSPYFVFIPWDYDNSFGIDYFGTQWQYTDIVDWPSNTRNYWAKQGAHDKTSHIPLVQNLLRNHDLCQYYLDHLEHLLDTAFSRERSLGLIGPEGGGGLWDRVRHAAYLEADTPYSPPFTGRQFTNDEVYLTGYKQNEIARERRRSRASSTTCGCAATARGNSSRRCARTIPAAQAGPRSPGDGAAAGAC